MKNKVYAVLKGRKPGVYHTYEECKEQIEGFSNQCFRSFENEKDAKLWLEKGEEGLNHLSAKLLRKLSQIETNNKEG